MKYPHNAKAVVDVTKAPYFCDNTGKNDCTEALCRAVDDVLRPNIEGIEKALNKLNASSDPNYTISFEIRKKDGVLNVIFPEELEPAKILYFPNGTYLVSDTISHSLESLRNILSGNRRMEINRQIYIHGESAEGTVIRLKDNCPGFGFGDQKPIISYTRMEQSNIAMTNHHFELISRSELRVYGVNDVHSFNDEGILLESTMGLLTVGGNNLRITKLNLEQGEVCLRGEINTLVYNDNISSVGNGRGLMSKLFR